jgi:hypothetical protein
MLAGLSVLLTSCQCTFFDSRQEAQAIVFDKRPNIAGGPTGNFGTINVNPSTDLISNTSSTGCFPTSGGWDKYYATGYFLGPGATANPNNFPNTSSTAVTITTVDAANGMTLDTGILINYEFNPNDKVCNDDVGSGNNPKLSTATKTLDNNKRYRLTVFFKSSTIGSLTTIKVNWQYQ